MVLQLSVFNGTLLSFCPLSKCSSNFSFHPKVRVQDRKLGRKTRSDRKRGAGRVRFGLLHHVLLMSLGFSSYVTASFAGTAEAGRADVLWLRLLATSHSLKAARHTTGTTPRENHTCTHSLRGEPGWLAARLLDWLGWESMDGEQEEEKGPPRMSTKSPLGLTDGSPWSASPVSCPLFLTLVSPHPPSVSGSVFIDKVSPEGREVRVPGSDWEGSWEK